MKEWNTAQYLKGLYTKQLMAIRDTIHQINGDPYKVYYGRDYYEVSLEQVLAELATREHVLNKTEAKSLRQLKAKAKRNR